MTHSGDRRLGRRQAGIIRFALTAIMVAVAFVVLPAAPASAKFSSLVIDASSGQEIEAVEADTRRFPASLTKMMTLYLLFDAIERKQVKLSTPIKISARAARQPASKLGLPPGSTISVHDAILAMTVNSANDIAVAVAEALDKSERDFALRMTAQAHKLGMNRTTFRNASGLFHRGQMTTARDMATLARALLRDFPQQYRYFSTATFTFEGRTHQNHNKLLESYDGTDGIKTGYISASGFNLVASATRDGRRLIGVVLGGDTASARNRHMADLLDAGFQALALGKITPTIRQAAAPEVASPAKTTAAVATKAPAAKPKKAAEPKKTVAMADEQADEGSAVGGGEWAVQVGAYRSRDPAYEAARQAIEKAPAVLSEGVIKIVPLKKKRHVLYRARIAGFEKDQADNACRSLERKGMACLVVSMKGVQVAANP